MFSFTRSKNITAAAKITPLTPSLQLNISEPGVTADDYIKPILDYLAQNIEDLKVLEITTLEELEYITTQCAREGGSAVESKLRSFGWSSEFGWLTMFTKFDDLLLSLRNIYLLNHNHSKGSKRLLAAIEEKQGNDEKRNALSAIESCSISFFPDSLVSHLTSQQSIRQPFVSKLSGALMIADISGFTKFSSQMCALGAVGLDSLYNVTNDFMGLFVSVIYDHDGDVISFAGDALIAIFPSRLQCHDESESVACARALACAAKLNLLAQSSSSGHAYSTLSAHFAVVRGDFFLGSLGGLDDEWTYVCTGRRFSELAECLDLAGPREVVCSLSCFQAASQGDEGPEILRELQIFSQPIFSSEKNVRLVHSSSLSSEEDELLNGSAGISFSRMSIFSRTISHELLGAAMKFVPPPIRNAVDTDSLSHLSELRRVTTVFMKLDSFTPAMQSDPLSLQPFFKLIQEKLKESGGYLRQFLVDDKGCVAIAFWGVPMFTSSNDSSRGLYFSLSMISTVKAIGHQVSVGVTSGEVYCGLVGSAIRQDYVCIGDKVNLAARLMGKARGRVLVDKETYKLVTRKERMCLILAEPLKLKGLVTPYQPFTYASADLPVLMTDKQLYGSHTILRRDLVEQLVQASDRLIQRSAAHKEKLHREASSSELKSTIILETAKPKPSGGKAISESTTPVMVTMLVGPRGSAKSTAAQVFELAATRRGIRCLHVTATAEDEAVPYRIMQKIFSEIIGQETFGDERLRHQFVSTLVTRMYPGMESKQAMVMSTLEVMLDLHSHANSDEHESDPNASLLSGGRAYGRSGKSPGKSGRPGAVATRSGKSDISRDDGVKAHSQDSALVADAGNRVSPPPGSGRGDALGRRARSGKGEAASAGRTRSGKGEAAAAAAHADEEVDKKVAHKTQRKPSRLRMHVFRGGQESNTFLRDTLAVLLGNSPAAIIIENANFADDRSWQELKKISESTLRVSVLITIRSHNCSGSTSAGSSQGAADSLKRMKTAGRSVFASAPKGHFNDEDEISIVSWRGGASGRRGGEKGERGVESGESEACKELQVSKSSGFDMGATLSASDDFMAIMTSTNTNVIEMTRLSEAEITVMLKKLLGESVTDHVAKTVFDASSGLPFWVKFIVRYVQQNGLEEFMRSVSGETSPNKEKQASFQESKRADATSLSEQRHGSKRKPSTHDALKFLIVYRLEQLTSEQQVVVKHASVIGDNFSPKALSAILPEQLRADALQHLNALVEHGLVFRLEDASVVVFSFHNEVIRKTIYGSIPPSDVSKIHLSMARFLESYFAADLRPVSQLLSYHYRSTVDNRLKAFTYTMKSAEDCVSQEQYLRALQALRAARDLALGHVEVRVLSDVVETAMGQLELETYGKAGKRWAGVARLLSCESHLLPLPQTQAQIAAALRLAHYRNLLEEFKAVLMQLNQRLGASVGGANPRSGSVGAMRSAVTRRRDEDDGLDGDEGGRDYSGGRRGRGGWARWNPFARNPNRRVSIESPYADNSEREQVGGAGSPQRRSAWDKGGSGASKGAAAIGGERINGISSIAGRTDGFFDVRSKDGKGADRGTSCGLGLGPQLQ